MTNIFSFGQNHANSQRRFVTLSQGSGKSLKFFPMSIVRFESRFTRGRRTRSGRGGAKNEVKKEGCLTVYTKYNDFYKLLTFPHAITSKRAKLSMTTSYDDCYTNKLNSKMDSV